MYGDSGQSMRLYCRRETHGGLICKRDVSVDSQKISQSILTDMVIPGPFSS